MKINFGVNSRCLNISYHRGLQTLDLVSIIDKCYLNGHWDEAIEEFNQPCIRISEWIDLVVSQQFDQIGQCLNRKVST